MKELVMYISQVIVSSGLLYTYYHFFLRNRRFHQYNRFFLLAATLLGLLIPLLRIDVYFDSPQGVPAIYQVLTEVHGRQEHLSGTGSASDWKHVGFFIYGTITLVLFTRLLIGVMLLIQLKRKSKVERLENVLLIHTLRKGTPYSFFRWLFWNDQIEIHGPAGQRIFRHEIFHIQQKHSWDILFLELLSVVGWINPFFHFIKKETRTIHEFLADRFAAGDGKEWEYAEILVMQTLETHQKLVNPFFHNQIKRRIAMITNSPKAGYHYLRKLMALPVLAVVTSLVAVHCTAKKSSEDLPGKPNDEIQTLSLKPTDTPSDLKRPGADTPGNATGLRLQPVNLSQNPQLSLLSRLDQSASFPGGQAAWQSFLVRNLRPDVSVNNGAPPGNYKVVVQFVVATDGKLSDLKPISHNGYGMEEEVVRLMKLSPDWTPAKQGGKNVKAYTRQPVTFAVTED
jgi:hypothetical protein